MSGAECPGSKTNGQINGRNIQWGILNAPPGATQHQNARGIPREEILLILPVITSFPGYLFLATILTEIWVRLTLRSGLRWLSWFTQPKWKWYPERQGCQETVLASRLNCEGSLEFPLTGHRNIVSTLKSTGSSPKLHTQRSGAQALWFPPCCCFRCFPTFCSPLSSQPRPEAGSQDSQCLPAGTAEQLALCSAGCPRTAP